jgi:4-hydroxymandelate oxidase
MDSADFDALEAEAKARMAPGAFAFVQAGADDEITVAENIAAWRALRLRPRVLRDITAVDTSTTVLGERVATPIMVAPSGRHKFFWHEGETATARGAAAAGAIYTLSTTASVPIEEVAAERGSAPQFFQLYLFPDRAWQEALLDRLAANGFRAVVFTVDQPLYGWSPRAARVPFKSNPDIRHINMPGAPMARIAYDPTLKGKVMFPATFRDLEWLARRSPIDIIVKGVLRGDEAVRCLDAGAKAIIVSNHGGRHLDTTVTTCAALPEVIAAVGDKAEVYVDGGIRRGTDILKALALGARAVLIGRPALWGLATRGADGVRDVLDHLRAELMRAMGLAGVAKLDEATADLVAPQSAPKKAGS